MKLTVMHWQNEADLARAARLAAQYMSAGYADGRRPKGRDCVIYSDRNSDEWQASVWGGPEHIRVQFLALSLTEETTNDQ